MESLYFFFILARKLWEKIISYDSRRYKMNFMAIVFHITVISPFLCPRRKCTHTVKSGSFFAIPSCTFFSAGGWVGNGLIIITIFSFYPLFFLLLLPFRSSISGVIKICKLLKRAMAVIRSTKTSALYCVNIDSCVCHFRGKIMFTILIFA